MSSTGSCIHFKINLIMYHLLTTALSLEYSGGQRYFSQPLLYPRDQPLPALSNYAPKLWNSLLKRVCCAALVFAFCKAPRTQYWDHPPEPLESQSLVHVHGTIQVLNWIIPKKTTFRYCVLNLVILFGFHAFGYSRSIFHSFIIH